MLEHFSKQRPSINPALCRFAKARVLASQRDHGASTQRPGRYQHTTLRYTGVRGQTDDIAGLQNSSSSSDDGTVSGTGNPEAALLQKQQDPDTGESRSPDSNLLIPQLYLFGR